MSKSGLTQAAADRIALRWYAMPAALCGLLALIWFNLTATSSVPITGTVSIAMAVLYGTFILGLAMFGFAYRYGQKRRDRWDDLTPGRKLLDLGTLTVSHVLTVSGFTAVIFLVITNAFKGLTFDRLTASLLIAAAVAVVMYILITLALTITINQIIAMLAVVMIGGVLLAMVTNQQDDWWQINLSYLGTAASIHSFTFNFTLVFSGLMMIALARFVFDRPKQQYPQWKGRVRALEGLFVATAWALAGVGLFPYTPDTILVQLHNGSATLLVILIMAMIVGLRWYIPAISREFVYTSYLFAVVLAVMVWLFQGIGYLSLTAFEISAFGVGFLWLILLMRNLQFLSSESAPAAAASTPRPSRRKDDSVGSTISI